MGRFFSALKSFFQRLFRKEPIPALPRHIFLRYPQGHEEDVETDVYYEDSYFFEDPEELDPSLATCSLGLAMASFSSNHLKEGLEQQPRNAIAFLQDCGFTSIEMPSYFSQEATSDDVAFIMGSKTLRGKEGKFTLIAIGIRGANYGKEWSSNLKIGLGEEHEGFAHAAKEVADFFQHYVQQHRIRGNVRVWVAGFSRAAAVTNLFGQNMPRELPKAKVTHVYAYGFACPNTTSAYRDVPSTCHAFVSGGDLVTALPLKQWGFGRYGTTHYLMLKLDNNPFYAVQLDLARILSKKGRFRHIEGADKEEFIIALTDLLSQRIPLQDFVSKFQDSLCGFMNLVDTKRDNPFQAIGEVCSDAIHGLLEKYSPFTLLNMIGSKKTDWDATLRPILIDAWKDKPNVLDPAALSLSVSNFFYAIREDLWTERNLFLTLFDSGNLASLLKEHDALVYLDALKVLDPKFQ